MATAPGHLPHPSPAPGGDPRRVPDSLAPGPRARARLPGQRRDRAEAAGGDRHARPLLARAQRERPPRRPHALRGGDRALRGGSRHDRAPPGRRAARGHLHPQRDRVLEPRRPRVGPRQRRRGRSDPAHRDGAPLEHRALVPPGEGGRREAGLGAGGRRRAPRHGGPRGRHGARSEAGRGRPRLQRARHHQPARPRSHDWPTRPGRSWSSTGRRPRRSCSSTCRTSERTSTGSRATRSTGPPGWAFSTVAASSSRPWSRSKGAAR